MLVVKLSILEQAFTRGKVGKSRVDWNLTMVELQSIITRQNRVQLSRPCTVHVQHKGYIRICRWSAGFGSSSARSRPFELCFWYVFLKDKIMLGCGEKPLIGPSWYSVFRVSEWAVMWFEGKCWPWIISPPRKDNKDVLLQQNFKCVASKLYWCFPVWVLLVNLQVLFTCLFLPLLCCTFCCIWFRYNIMLGSYHAWLRRRKTLKISFKSTNYKHDNTDIGLSYSGRNSQWNSSY
jgi:hypothetical protein